MNALVISGGGSKGAFAGGIAEYLIACCGHEYDIYVGTSTGALLVPMLAAGKLSEVKKTYLNVRNSDVFNINPFIIKKKGSIFYTKINHLNTVRMFARGCKTFGETKNLRKLIAKIFTKTNYNLVRQSKKEVIITVANLTNYKVEYKSIHDYDYEDFCDWMWASSNIVPFMSLLRKNGHEYADGGFGNYLPIQPAINAGAKNVDAIMLRPEKYQINNLPSTDAFDVLLKAFDFMLNQIGSDDLVIGQLSGQVKEVDISSYFPEHILTEHSFIFDPTQMQAWWKQGYEYAENAHPKSMHIG